MQCSVFQLLPPERAGNFEIKTGLRCVLDLLYSCTHCLASCQCLQTDKVWLFLFSSSSFLRWRINLNDSLKEAFPEFLFMLKTLAWNSNFNDQRKAEVCRPRSRGERENDQDIHQHPRQHQGLPCLLRATPGSQPQLPLWILTVRLLSWPQVTEIAHATHSSWCSIWRHVGLLWGLNMKYFAHFCYV